MDPQSIVPPTLTPTIQISPSAPSPPPKISKVPLLVLGVVIGFFAGAGAVLAARYPFAPATPSFMSSTPNEIPATPTPSSSQGLFPKDGWQVYRYKSGDLSFQFQYPNELVQFSSMGDASFVVDYPPLGEIPVLEVDVYKTNLDSVSWWNKEGKTHYPWFISSGTQNFEIETENEVFEPVNGKYVPKNDTLAGVQIVGQTKYSDGTTQSSFLYVFQPPFPSPVGVVVFFSREEKVRNYYYKEILKTFSF